MVAVASDGNPTQKSSSAVHPPSPRRLTSVVSFCLRCAAAYLVVTAARPVAVDARSRIITAASSVADEWCAGRIRRSLAAVVPAATMDLSGYAIHRALRSVPGVQMYMTGIRAKVVEDGRPPPRKQPWTRVDGCRYFPAENVLEARMHFGKPLTVTGTVRLLHADRRRTTRRFADDVGEPAVCNVAVRLRGAGVSLSAAPVAADLSSAPSGFADGRPTGAFASMTIRTTAVYTDTAAAATAAVEDVGAGPLSAFVSVHAYRCADLLKKDDTPPIAAAQWPTVGEDDDAFEPYADRNSRVLNKRPQQQQQQQQLLLYGDDDGQRAMLEIEEALVRGVRQLLAKHLERTLQPALRESLMNRMGYVVSYG